MHTKTVYYKITKPNSFGSRGGEKVEISDWNVTDQELGWKTTAWRHFSHCCSSVESVTSHFCISPPPLCTDTGL